MSDKTILSTYTHRVNGINGAYSALNAPMRGPLHPFEYRNAQLKISAAIAYTFTPFIYIKYQIKTMNLI